MIAPEEKAEQPKPLTVKEFRIWLQGVEEMQEANWTPSPSQWKRIREKLELVNDAQPVGLKPVGPVYRNNEPPMLPPGFPVPPMYANPGAGDPPPAAAGPSSLAPVPPVPPAAPPRQVRTLNGLPVTLASGNGQTAKTPDIDTSHGKNYNTPFV